MKSVRSVDCTEIRNALVRGQNPTGQDFDAHVRSCAGCAELLAQGARLGHGLVRVASSDELGQGAVLEAVKRQIRAERGVRAYLSSRSSVTRVAIGCSVAAALGAVQLVFSPRPDLAAYPALRMLAILSVYALASVICARYALWPLSRAKPGRTWWLTLALATLALPFFVALLPEVHTGHLASAGSSGVVGAALRCFSYGGAFGAVLVGIFWVLDRSTPSTWYSIALTAAFAGLGANLLLHVHCPITQPLHLILGHASIGLGWLVGYAALKRILLRTAR